MERCCCDGTLMFYRELMSELLLSIFKGESYHKGKEPNDFFENVGGYDRVYEIGDIILGDEYGDEFTTEEKPWMKSRFTVFLPVKMRFIKRGVK